MPCGGGVRTASVRSRLISCTCWADVPDRAALAAELLSRAHTEFHAKPEYVLVVPTPGRTRIPPSQKPCPGVARRPRRPD